MKFADSFFIFVSLIAAIVCALIVLQINVSINDKLLVLTVLCFDTY
jgi:hypothetical protein